MKSSYSFGNRLLAMVLCLVLVGTMLPTQSVVAAAQSEPTAVLENISVGEEQEFSVQVIPGDENAGAQVTLDIQFDSGDKTTNLQYQDENGEWVDYAPEATFAIESLPTKYRANFSVRGEDKLTFSVRSEGDELCKLEQVFTVKGMTQTSFGFKYPTPRDLTYRSGLTYTNIASGGQTNGVTYAIAEEYQKIASVNETGMVSFKKYGTVVVTATKPGDDVYEPITISYTITAKGTEQSPAVTFQYTEPEELTLTMAEGLTFTNKASGGNNGNWEYTSDDEDIATVDGNGKVTIYKPGTVTITATRLGNNLYLPISGSYTLVIEPAQQAELSFEKTAQDDLTLTMAEGLTFENMAIGGFGQGEVTYAITGGDEGVATIDETTGQLTIHKFGTVTVTATKAADGDIAEQPASYTLTINAVKQTDIALTDATSPVEVVYGEDNNKYSNPVINALGSGELIYTIEADENNQDVATVDPATGEVTILKMGTVTVKATKQPDSIYEGKELSYTLVIHGIPQTDMAFENAADSVEVVYGKDDNKYSNPVINALGSGELSYTIEADENNQDVATVDPATGEVTILKAGTVTVKASKKSDGCYEGKQISYSLIIKHAQQDALSFIVTDADQLKLTMAEGLTFTNTVTGGTTDKVITYAITGGDEGVATIDETTGKLTILKYGTVTVTATKPGDDHYEDATASYTLVIEGVAQGPDFSLDSDDFEMVYGENGNTSHIQALNAQGTGELYYEIVSSQPEGVATIDRATGELTILKAGQVTVKAVKEGDNVYLGGELPYTLVIAKAQQADFGFAVEGSAAVTYGDNGNVYENAASGGEGTGEITYAITGGDEGVATIDEVTGEVTILKAGTITVEATKAADDCYDAVTAAYTLTVSKAEQVDMEFNTRNDVELTYNPQMLQYSNSVVNGKGEGKLTYTIEADENNQDVATIDPESGVVTILKAGTVTVKATKEADSCYEGKVVIYKLTIQKAPQSGMVFNTQGPVELTYDPENLTYINAVKNDMGTGELVYEIVADESNQNVATVNAATGEVTILKAGTVTVKATKAADDCYEGKEISYSLTVNKATHYYFDFDTPGTVTVTYNDNNNRYINSASSPWGNGAVTYAITGGDEGVATIDSDTGEVTILKAGTVTVEATKAADGWYKEISKTYTLIILKDAQDGFCFTTPGDVTVTYGENNNIYTNAAIHDMGTGALVYEIVADKDNQGVATVNAATGEVTILKAGTVTVKAIKAADDCYEGAEIAYQLTVNLAHQTAAIPHTADATVTYNDNGNQLDTKVQKLLGECKVSYEIVADRNNQGVATVSEDGMITVLKAGTVTVKITVDSDGCYEGSEFSFRLTVNKADQTIQFTEGTLVDGVLTVNKGYNAETYTNPVERSELHGTGKETYKIAENKKLGVTIHAETGELSFEDSEHRVGTLTIQVTKEADDCYNACSATYVLQINYEPVPEIPFTIEGDKLNSDSEWYTGDITVTAPTGYLISYSNSLRKDNKWAQEVVYTQENTLGQENIFQVYLYNIATKSITAGIPVKVKLDKTAPENLKITYTNTVWNNILSQIFNQQPENVIVEFESEDANSKIVKVEYSLDKGQTYTLLADAENGKGAVIVLQEMENVVAFRVTNEAGHVATTLDEAYGDQFKQVLVVDNVSPTRSISFTPDRMTDAATELDVTGEYSEDANVVLYYGTAGGTKQAQAVATLTVTEAHFNAEDIKLFDNNEPISPDNGWTQVEGQDNTWTATVTLTEEGKHVIAMTYLDFSKNEMRSYTSQTIVVDKTNPVISVDYALTQPVNTIENRGDFFAGTQTATITIEEENFRADDVIVKVTAKDILGNNVLDDNNEIVKAYADAAILRESWKHDGSTHTLELEFSADANYTLDVEYTDLAGNVASDMDPDLFTVDTTAPSELTICYSQAVSSEILDALTLGYYNAPVTVTIRAKDMTSGIFSFVYSCVKSKDSSDVNVQILDEAIQQASITQEENGVFKAEFVVPQGVLEATNQFDGIINFTAIDCSGRSASHAETQRIVVDNIAPLRTVTFTPDRMVNADTLEDVTGDYEESAAVILYYGTAGGTKQAKAVATLEVTEANFFFDDLKVYDNGNAISVDNGWTKVEGKADTWTATVTLETEGDHVLTMAYTDRSTNTMQQYASQRIVIDKTDPLVSVGYEKSNPVNSVNGRDYFAEAQTATVTITDRNFRADDVVINVTVKDVSGNNLPHADGIVNAYTASGKIRENWTPYEADWRRQGDTYTLVLKFDSEANYTLDVEYADLAGNKAADMEADLFTVDYSKPTNLEIKYSNHVSSSVMNNITFGYYNAKVTVTITARDNISGIYNFVYSYLNAKGVSGVNAQLVNQQISATHVGDGIYTATFTVPRDVLDRSHQFNGTVSFTASDCSGNSSALNDDRRLVVDNISPTASVSFDEPVQQVNGISYYDGIIHGAIQINEANFVAADVNVTVTKDGQRYDTSVNWGGSGDNHTGTFTLEEDGNYVVSVAYSDRSGNAMRSYTSNQLTLDTVKPVIQVSNIQANSANKDEVYGFTVTLEDINLNPATMAPVLTAVVKGEDGTYTTKTVDLGEATAIQENKSYSYTVENLPEDALYTLTCQASDLSGNTATAMELADGKSYESVQFSINRSGSTFGFGDAYAQDLVSQYYVYSVDAPVTVFEVNVDPIENYEVSLNGQTLEEGKDYTTQQTSEPGQWSKRSYTLNQSLFQQEGEYRIVVSSTDKADTTAFSDVKNLPVAFVVDQTAPAITITGLASGDRYQTNEQTVTLMPTDEGGRLNGLKVVVLDAQGEPLKDESGNDISLRFEMSGEELLEHLEQNNGIVTLTIPEGLNNQVQIICSDCSANAEGKPNEYNEIFDKVTVSDNQLVIFYANQPLFYGTAAAGVAALLLLIILLVKRKKKEEK